MSTRSLLSTLSDGTLNPTRSTRSDALAYQLMDALHAMELHGLGTAVSYAFMNDLELGEVNIAEFLRRPSPSPLPGLPAQPQPQLLSQSVAQGVSGSHDAFGHNGFGGLGVIGTGGAVPLRDKHVSFEQLVVFN